MKFKKNVLPIASVLVLFTGFGVWFVNMNYEKPHNGSGKNDYLSEDQGSLNKDVNGGLLTKVLQKTETQNPCKKNKLSTLESSSPVVVQSDVLNRSSTSHESHPNHHVKVNLSAKRDNKNWREWRYLQADLNDVYSVGNVRMIRNLIIQDYLNLYHKIFDEQDRNMKIILDGYAKKELGEKLQTLRGLAENAETKTEENEAYLALSEINLTANNYSKACDYAQRVVADSEQEVLLAQAYYYLRIGYAKQGKAEKAEDYSRVLLKEFPKQANRILGLDSSSYPIEDDASS